MTDNIYQRNEFQYIYHLPLIFDNKKKFNYNQSLLKIDMQFYSLLKAVQWPKAVTSLSFVLRWIVVSLAFIPHPHFYLFKPCSLMIKKWVLQYLIKGSINIRSCIVLCRRTWFGALVAEWSK